MTGALEVGSRPSRRRAIWRDRSGGAGGADDPAVAADEERVELEERVFHRLLDQLRLLARDRIAVDEELGEPHRPELQAAGGLGLLAAGADDLGGAAANVEEQRAFRGRLSLEDAEADQARLLRAADHFQADAGAGADGADQLGAVRGLADGAGGDGAHLRGARAIGELREPLQRDGGAGDGAGGEATGAEDLLAEADRDAIFGEDQRGSGGGHLRDLQADRVRAEVDDREHGVARGRLTAPSRSRGWRGSPAARPRGGASGRCRGGPPPRPGSCACTR